MKKILLLALILVNSLSLFCQEDDFRIGAWRSHFPYRNLLGVAADNKGTVYAASRFSVFSYQEETGLVTVLSKINSLSDVGISCIKYNHQFDLLFIAYENSNIDILKNGRTINISDIYRSNVLGKKTINDIYFHDNYAYLSCGFGIVVVDIEKYEIADTYYIGPSGQYLEVYDFTYWKKENLFVVATETGLLCAKNEPNVNLSYFANWESMTDMPTNHKIADMVETFADYLFVNICYGYDEKGNHINNDTLLYYNGNSWDLFVDIFSKIYSIDVYEGKLLLSIWYNTNSYDASFNRVFFTGQHSGMVSPRPNQAIIDNKGTYWVADGESGLVKYPSQWNGVSVIPSGPDIASTFNLVSHKNNIFLLPGGYNASWAPGYKEAEISIFDSKEWTNVNNKTIPHLSDYHNLVDIAIDPKNGNHYFLASYGYGGLIEVLDNKIVNVYDGSNSPLEQPSSMSDPRAVRVGGVKFDNKGNLWVTNSASSKSLQVLMADGNWGNVNVGSAISGVEASTITIDNYGGKWLKIRNINSHSGIYVINDNNTPEYAGDDQVRRLTPGIGNGNLPGQSVYSIANDKDGKIWIGSDMGVAVFHYPENIFGGGNYDASQILVEADGDIRPLLESETVTAICVDHGNRKWFGTSSSGVYYTSPDGKTELAHFTKENSPLLSNTINHIAVNEMGEVFFLTMDGVCSFKGESVPPVPNYETIYVYPNPVRPEYDGPIAVAGLKQDSFVKITDSAGKIVYSTISNGGQAVWDGYTPSGKKAASGVYFVFAVDSQGQEKASTKFLIVR